MVTELPGLALVWLLSAGAPIQTGTPGRLIEHVPRPSDPTETYTLYLPSRYVATRPRPLLLVFDPGARAARAPEVFREAAERRSLELAFVHTSVNVPRDFAEKRDFTRAAMSLELATDIHPERPERLLDRLQ